jgi:hypothetical protein
VSNLVKYNLDFQGEVTVDTPTFTIESASIVNITVSQCAVTIPSQLPIGTRKEIRKLGENETVAITITALNETFTRDALSTLTLINTGSFFILEKVSAARWDIVQSGFVEIDKDNFVKNPLTKNSVLNINQSGTLTITWDDTATDILNTGALKVIAPSSGTNRYFDIQLKTLNANEVGQQWSIKTSYKLATAADDLVSFFLFDGTTELPTTLNSLPHAGGGVQSISGAVYPTTVLSNVKLRVRFKDNAACTLYLADMSVGPFNPYGGAAIGNWMEYTPSNIAGFGTPTAVDIRYRRVGSNLEIAGGFISGTPSAVTAYIKFPLGLTTSNPVQWNAYGRWTRESASNNDVKGGSIIGYSASDGVYFGVDEYVPANSPFVPAQPPQFISSGQKLSFYASFPIAQWTSNINLVQDFQEFASNSTTLGAAGTAYDTGMVSGQNGSLIPNSIVSNVLTGFSTTRYRINFTKPISTLDSLFLEVSYMNGPWFPSSQLTGGGGIQYLSTAAYGMGISAAALGSNSLHVIFGNAGMYSTGSYGAAGGSWVDVGTNWRWRVRKVSNGNMAEAPMLTTQLPALSGRLGNQGVFTGPGRIPWLEMLTNKGMGILTYDSTNRRFYVSQAGEYHVTLSLFGHTGATPVRVLIGKNIDAPTSSNCVGMIYSSDTLYKPMPLSCIISMVPGDYFVTYVAEGSLYNASNDLFNYFTVHKLSGIQGLKGDKGDNSYALYSP